MKLCRLHLWPRTWGLQWIRHAIAMTRVAWMMPLRLTQWATRRMSSFAGSTCNSRLSPVNWVWITLPVCIPSSVIEVKTHSVSLMVQCIRMAVSTLYGLSRTTHLSRRPRRIAPVLIPARCQLDAVSTC